MGGRTLVFWIGDGNQTNVNYPGSIPRPFWRWFEGRRWHSLETLFPGTTWSPSSASCHRSVLLSEFWLLALSFCHYNSFKHHENWSVNVGVWTTLVIFLSIFTHYFVKRTKKKFFFLNFDRTTSAHFNTKPWGVPWKAHFLMLWLLIIVYVMGMWMILIEVSVCYRIWISKCEMRSRTQKERESEREKRKLMHLITFRF